MLRRWYKSTCSSTYSERVGASMYSNCPLRARLPGSTPGSTPGSSLRVLLVLLGIRVFLAATIRLWLCSTS